jgi:hypothetical protein
MYKLKLCVSDRLNAFLNKIWLFWKNMKLHSNLGHFRFFSQIFELTGDWGLNQASLGSKSTTKAK